jgi:copper oxidase (laccase) domain-containing protein
VGRVHKVRRIVTSRRSGVSKPPYEAFNLTLQAMCAQGARPADIDALLGPAICGSCYEVPPDMQADVERRLPGSAARTTAGTTGLDLRAGIARQLAAAGVPEVVHDPRCTAEDPDLYSHRRDGVTGRQAAVAWID